MRPVDKRSPFADLSNRERRQAFRASGFAASFRRGVFQYGLLHFGQTSGSLLFSRGTHSCPHRSHRKPQILTFGIMNTYNTAPPSVKYIT